MAQSPLTPEAALKAMMDGNERYVAGQLPGFPMSDGPAAVALFRPADIHDLIERRAK